MLETTQFEGNMARAINLAGSFPTLATVLLLYIGSKVQRELSQFLLSAEIKSGDVFVYHLTLLNFGCCFE